jgi:hypothetical protein
MYAMLVRNLQARRHCVTRSQRGKLCASADEERIGADQKRTCPCLRHAGKCLIELGLGASVQDVQP